MNECKMVNGGSHLRGFVVEVVIGEVVIGEVVVGGVVVGGAVGELNSFVLPAVVLELTPLKQNRNCYGTEKNTLSPKIYKSIIILYNISRTVHLTIDFHS